MAATLGFSPKQLEIMCAMETLTIKAAQQAFANVASHGNTVASYRSAEVLDHLRAWEMVSVERLSLLQEELERTLTP